MSDDNKNSEPFDFDFDSFNADEPQKSAGEDSFDLENPFGEDVVVSRSGAAVEGVAAEDTPHSTEERPFDLGDSFGDDLAASDSGLSADNPYLSDSAVLDGDSPEESAETGDLASDVLEEATVADKKKKGFGGWFSKGKKGTEDAGKGKPAKETKEKPKKEKVAKEKKPVGERMPRDLGTILCIALSAFWLVSLLMFNIAGFLTRGDSIMQTLCFLGAINIIGLPVAAVPLLFYKFPKERTLPNVMLGVATAAMFGTLLIAVTEFYSYGFILQP
jgi:hypothetical protein